MDTLRGALECVDVATGALHRPEHVEALIEQVAGVDGYVKARLFGEQPS